MADLITLDDYKLLEGVNSTQYDEKFETLLVFLVEASGRKIPNSEPLTPNP